MVVRKFSGLQVLWLALIVWGCCQLPMQAGKVLNDSLVTRPFRHHVWQAVLTNNVNSKGEVDFGRLRAHPRRLNEDLDQLAASSPENDPGNFPTPNDRQAYWINAHNALAMRIILDHYPLTSTAQVANLETDAHYLLGGKPYTLKKIRQKLSLLARQDPQLMFTLTDYSLGAPVILTEAYEGSTLKTQKQLATTQSLANPQVIEASTGSQGAQLKLSPIFRSYERGLFARTVASVEDQDSLNDADTQEAGIIPISNTPNRWTDTLRPFMPPSIYSGIGKHGGMSVEFMPNNPTLRQIRY